MIDGAWLFLLCVGYVAILFAIAWLGDRNGGSSSGSERPWIYALALGVYCTSWTFYGAVGSAVNGGLSFLPIYLGPIVMFLFATGLLRRIVIITRRHSITSIADFIASRYGKARSLAVLVTVIAVVGTVPYIALQLKAVSMSYDLVVVPEPGLLLPGLDTALFTAIGLALFAVLFGTRRLDASEHRQ
ncbi:MAG: hybrid sensor histidine kinase/response regulator, partial [Gammaproteobacteria bacterium]|nr:hybrid sensor histidine kinase/response regulator [Gammaproteobacteria bacterium]